MRAMLWILPALLLACGPDFEDVWDINGYRVIGIEASPPEIGPDDSVTLTVWDLDTESRTPTYAWSLCLFSLGAVTGFECLDEALMRPVPSMGPEATIDFGPGGINIRALYEAFGPVVTQDGESVTLEDGFDVYVHLISSVPGGRTVSTYKRVRIRDGADLNTNPTVASVEIDGASGPFVLAPNEKVEVELMIDPASRETTPDGRQESFLYRWYTVDGTLDLGFGPVGRIVDYRAPKEPGTDQIYAVVRDARGGTALRRIDIEIREGEQP